MVTATPGSETSLPVGQAKASDSATSTSRLVVWTAAWAFFLLTLSYWPVFRRLAAQWSSDENMSHGFVVGPVVLFLIWNDSSRLLSLPVKPNFLGLLPLLLGGVLLCVGSPNLTTYTFISRVGFLFSLIGVICLLFGWGMLRALAFPLSLLLFMVPPPGFLYEQITIPLQFFASSLSELILSALGYTVLREGNILFLPRQTLSVIEACSGLRSLFSLTFLTIVYAYLMESNTRLRWLLGLTIIPIAIVANAMRIVITGALGQVDARYTHGWYHDATGYSTFVIAFVLLYSLHKLLLLFPLFRQPLTGAPQPQGEFS